MQKILIQLDTDSHASSFDRVVAVDAGAEHLFSYAQVTAENVVSLLHGAMFTRGPKDLKSTAVFIGGADVAAAEKVLEAAKRTFFGPMRVSVMMDSNGCNTTASAAVALAGRHATLKGARAVVLGATGPVGLRAAQLLASEGAEVVVTSRSQSRAESACETIAGRVGNVQLRAAAVGSEADAIQLCRSATVLIAAGAAGICFLPEGVLESLPDLKVAIDLNAVPPTGIAEIAAGDKAVDRSGTICFGALGAGGLKMKVHRKAIQELFMANDRIFDTMEIYALATQLASDS